MNKIDVFELVIDTDDESGVSQIAFVDQPAIESNWHMFSKQSEYKFAIKDEEKRIVEGYFMIADLRIPRLNPETGEKFFVWFSAKTIEAIREKQSKQGLTNNFNLMHDPNQIADGVYMLDNLIIDNERGKIAPNEFEKVPNGSLWGSAKVDNDEIWEAVKDGTFKGFSVEGMFKQTEGVKVDEDVIQQIREKIQNFEKSIDDTIQVINNKTIESMSLKVIEDLKKILFNEEVVEVVAETTEQTFVSAELADGSVINVEPGLEEGASVSVEVDGELVAIPDGDYPLADGTVLSIAGGVIASIKAVEEEAPEDMTTEAPATKEVEEAKVRKIIESIERIFEAQFEAISTELETVKAEFNAFKIDADAKDKAIFEAVVEIAKEPSVETKKTKSGFMVQKPKSFADRLAAERANRKK